MAAASAHQWVSIRSDFTPSRRSKRVRSTIPRATRAAEDVSCLWSRVNFEGGEARQPRDLRGWETVRERCWIAAYDAPFHGVPGGPYMHGRFSDMNEHIDRRHRRFLESSRRALCGAAPTPEEFADALNRVSRVLRVTLDQAVECIFGEPTLVAATEADIVRRLVELRREHEGEDLGRLVVQSRGALLAGAADVVCRDSDF